MFLFRYVLITGTFSMWEDRNGSHTMVLITDMFCSNYSTPYRSMGRGIYDHNSNRTASYIYDHKGGAAFVLQIILVQWNLRITTTHGTKKYGRNFGVVVILRWSLSGVPLYLCQSSSMHLSNIHSVHKYIQ